MERFKLFPSIGIARVGGSIDEFFICPESDASSGIEINTTTGIEDNLLTYKDLNGLIKKQAARFRICEFNIASNEYLPIDMSQVTVEWRVHLVNKKAAVARAVAPPATAPATPLPLRPNATTLLIDSGEAVITGANQNGVKLVGEFKAKSVELGELKTDKHGNLLVLGGNGLSESIPAGSPIQNFYYSDNWYDDTSDGSVKAILTLADGAMVHLTAWVIVAPPDFAPHVKAVVTLYDIMLDSITAPAARPASPSFHNDILPIIERYRRYKWVSTVLPFSISATNEELANTAAANRQLRSDTRDEILRIEDPTLDSFLLTPYQIHILEKWVQGSFVNDINNPMLSPITGNTLTRAALDTTVGQGFFPGIEGGIVTTSASIYSEPFTIDHTKVSPGDITGLMALPWQADFLKCQGNWWPSQRPDNIKTSGGGNAFWARGINNHMSLINNFNKLGFVKPFEGGQIEQERSL